MGRINMVDLVVDSMVKKLIWREEHIKVWNYYNWLNSRFSGEISEGGNNNLVFTKCLDKKK
jgi:hypothetical protein